MLSVSEWPGQPYFIDVLVKGLLSCDIACVHRCFNVCLNPANPLYRLFARYCTFKNCLQLLPGFCVLNSI